jgi:hypothetical protein
MFDQMILAAKRGEEMDGLRSRSVMIDADLD